MAARDNTSRTPADPDLPLNLIDILTWHQSHVAMFTMPPPDYFNYVQIELHFLTLAIPYAEFHRRLEALLDVHTAPHYQHLRIFLDIFHRAFYGEELHLDNLLCFFPIALSILLQLFALSVHHSDTLKKWIREFDPQRERRLYAHRAREANHIQNRRLGFDLVIASRDSIRDPEWNPGVLLICFLNWCQEQAARVMMPPQEYEAYVSLTVELREGMTTYHEFLREMQRVLGDPRYENLRVWWNVHKLEVWGGVRMLENSMLRFPVALCVTMILALCSALFGDKIWDTCLSNVRRREE